MSSEIKVGIADFNIAKYPKSIMTTGLGSCVGIVLYDEEIKLVGLAHIMLPDSLKFRKIDEPKKFADLAIPLLINKMIEVGAIKERLKAKIVGGSSMFVLSNNKGDFDIGTRNVLSVKKILEICNIPIIAEDVGGNIGRTIIVNSEDGIVHIRRLGHNNITI